LVYFDQFSLISPLHLGLVGLGIVVLLVGVWVVSIQAGGGGDEEDSEAASQEGEASSLLSATADDHVGDIESRGRAQSMSNTRPAYGATRMDRQAVSESHVDALPSFQVNYPTEDSVSPLSTSATSPLPLGRRQPPPSDSPHLLSPSSRARRRHRPSLSVVDTSPPLGGTSVLGGGLSIGLGPMSPGFSIVPRDRRRKVSGHSFADVVDEAVNARRRTVSGTSIPPLEESRHSEAPLEAAASSASPPSPGRQDAKRRWGWVKSLVRR